MKSFLAFFLVCFFFSLNSLAQTANPSPTPPSTVEDDDVVVINTTLIQIDVTVTDKKGKIVKDLKPEDFEIYENKEKQTITNFSFIENQQPKKNEPNEIKPQNSKIPLPPARIKPENTKRTIALVVDDLTLSFESTYYVRRALKKFVEEQMQEGDLVAIVRTGAGIGALQQFTNDKRILLAAIEKVKWNSYGSGGISAFPPIEASFADMMKNANPNMTEEAYQEALGREREQANMRSEGFANVSLSALNYVINGMKDFPGRKSVMLMSDGFSPLLTDREGFLQASSELTSAIKKVVDTANRSSVVVYTMDARGLQTLGLNAADNTSGLTPERINQQISERSTQLADTQATLKDIAEETGGFAIVNNNNLSGGIEKMLYDQTGYYLIGYQPDSDTFDPKTTRFNKLTIKVKNPDLKIRYRSGFFNSVIENKKETVQNASLTPQQKVSKAIFSPFSQSDINLSINSLFANDTKIGNYVRSFLHIKASDLDFTKESDGTFSTRFDFVAIAMGSNGEIVEQIGKTQSIILKKEGYEMALEKGFVFNFIFPFKKPGAYQIRVAFRDHKTDKIGTANQFVELPNLKKERLALSGIVVENLSVEDWQKEEKGEVVNRDPMGDTSLRRFKPNSVMRYGLEIYNAKLDAAKKPNLKMQLRIFQDSKLIHEGKLQDISFDPKDLPTVKTAGAFALGKQLKAGEYILQVVIFDALAKEKYQIATQFIPFEIIE
ncbi:MAG: VWA domain-containing protein [Pyrinomonadaceae bacterium]|nr:VWA domain-containing protein [Pyrinomonadaceae bacterium]